MSVSGGRQVWRGGHGVGDLRSGLALTRAAMIVMIVAGAGVPAAAQIPFEVVHRLPLDPIGPVADMPLIEGADGSLYGISAAGGVFNGGTFFKTSRLGVTTILYSFRPADGGPPFTFTRGANGNFYGLISPVLGTALALMPRFFSATPDGVVTLLGTTALTSPTPPHQGEPLVEMPDGNFYWFYTNGVFRISPIGEFTFIGAPVPYWSALSAVPSGDNELYVAFPHYGPYTTDTGAVVRMDLSGHTIPIHTFGAGPEGFPPKELVLASDGNLYGTTSSGGRFGRGTLFKLGTQGELVVLHAFAADEDGPSRLFQADDGYLYGVATARFRTPAAPGTILRASLDGSLVRLHAGVVDLTLPVSLMQASDGTLLGTTQAGIDPAFGSVFQLATDGTAVSLSRFTHGPEGSFFLGAPAKPGRTGGLIQAPDGTFYGVTPSGGRYDQGTAFKASPSGAFELLHAFSGGVDGGVPRAQLLLAGDGNLYGTTSTGGATNAGTIFRVTPSGSFTMLHAFAAAVDGAVPLARLIQASDGALYGTTSSGGVANAGSIFRLTLDGEFVVRHAFTDVSTGYPDTLVLGDNGSVYGTAAGSGTGRGVLFRLDVDGRFTVVHAFSAGEGRGPAGLIRTRDGNLYGTMTTRCGVELNRFFRVTPTGQSAFYDALGQRFCGTVTLAEGLDGDLYITAATDSSLGSSISRMTREGLVTAVIPTGAPLNTVGLTSPLLQAADGSLYGAGLFSSSTAGAIFRIGLLPRAVPSDLRSKLTVYRPSTGTWLFADGTSLPMGAAGDRPVPGDYNGDGVLDAALFRPSTGVWSIVGVGVTAFGLPGDIPVPADYDGDGTTDLAVFRPSSATWYIAGRDPIVFGAPGDVPVPGDYAGSGHAQIAVAHHGIFFVDGIAEPVAVGGRPEDLPVPADYDGDGRLDMAVYRPSAGSWLVRDAATGRRTTTLFGTATDRPAPQDLDGDGRAELVLFRRTTGTWFTWNARTGVGEALRFGAPGDQPIFGPAIRAAAPGDIDGDRQADFTVYRDTGEWLSNAFVNVGRAPAVPFGAPAFGDTPVPGDYDGDGTMDLAVFRQSTGQWFLAPLTRDLASVQWGAPALGDRFVPADYDGDGITDLAVYRQTTGEWFILLSTTGRLGRFTWGTPGTTDDLPVAVDFDGDGRADRTIYRQSTGEWFIDRSADGGATYIAGGDETAGAIPVPADYDGDGKADVAVFREAAGEWLITRSSTGQLERLSWGDGSSQDIAVPADYDGDGAADITVYRPTTGEWFVVQSSNRHLRQLQWGCPTCGDTPVLQPARH